VYGLYERSDGLIFHRVAVQDGGGLFDNNGCADFLLSGRCVRFKYGAYRATGGAEPVLPVKLNTPVRTYEEICIVWSFLQTQPIDAIHALNRLTGVSLSDVYPGLSLSCLAIYSVLLVVV